MHFWSEKKYQIKEIIINKRRFWYPMDLSDSIILINYHNKTFIIVYFTRIYLVLFIYYVNVSFYFLLL